jgi:hypothetical protein
MTQNHPIEPSVELALTLPRSAGRQVFSSRQFFRSYSGTPTHGGLKADSKNQARRLRRADPFRAGLTAPYGVHRHS